MAIYKYQHIKNARSIRLLELQPSDGTSTLRCTLIEASLDSAPQYKALSYTWGSSDLSRNAYTVQESNVVIDGICINQESEAERSQQVQLMGDIYRTAQQVLIWLGRETRESNLAFEYLSQFATQSSIPGRREAFGKFLALKFKQIGFDRRSELIEVVKHVLDRPWFTRMWTLQELALGTEILVLCGKASISWLSLISGVECVREALSHATSLTSTEDDLAGRILLHNALRWAVADAAGLKVPKLPQSMSFLDVLVISQSKKATDLKDKVFALYGIFQALKMVVPKPDYSKSVSEIYTETTQAAILHDRCPDILSSIIICGHRRDAPSWVPDWSGKMIGTTVFMSFHAAKDSSSHCCFSPDGKRLTLSSIRVDDIIMRGDSVFCQRGAEAGCKSNLNVFDETFESFKSIKEWYQYVRYLKHYRTGQSVEEAFFRTLIQDGGAVKGKGKLRDPERFRNSFQHWFLLVMNSRTKPDSETTSSIATAGPLPIEKASASNVKQLDPEEAFKQFSAASPFHSRVKILLSGKTFFVTKTGYMGTSSEATKVGDELVVFSGMRLPSVIRKEGNSYVYIGPAYAHGIMDGEAWEEKSALQLNAMFRCDGR